MVSLKDLENLSVFRLATEAEFEQFKRHRPAASQPPATGNKKTPKQEGVSLLRLISELLGGSLMLWGGYMFGRVKTPGILFTRAIIPWAGLIVVGFGLVIGVAPFIDRLRLSGQPVKHDEEERLRPLQKVGLAALFTGVLLYVLAGKGIMGLTAPTVLIVGGGALYLAELLIHALRARNAADRERDRSGERGYFEVDPLIVGAAVLAAGGAFALWVLAKAGALTFLAGFVPGIAILGGLGLIIVLAVKNNRARARREQSRAQSNLGQNAPIVPVMPESC